MVERRFAPAAERTMRKMMTARGPPNDRGKFVTMMKIGPRRFNVCSLAASDAEVEDAGYSPGSVSKSGNVRVRAHINEHTSNPEPHNPSRHLSQHQHHLNTCVISLSGTYRHHPKHAINTRPIRSYPPKRRQHPLPSTALSFPIPQTHR